MDKLIIPKHHIMYNLSVPWPKMFINETSQLDLNAASISYGLTSDVDLNYN